VASVPYVSNSKLEWLVINALSIFLAFFRYPGQLENCPGSAKNFREANLKKFKVGITVK